MLTWFGVSPRSGALHIADDPTVLFAINPTFGVMFFVNHPGVSLAVLGTVCLAVTGRRRCMPISGISAAVDPRRLARLRLPGAGHQLFRTRAPRARAPGGGRASALPPRARMGAAADDRPGDARRDHRQPGRHHGGLLAHPSGGAARPAAAARDQVHLEDHQGQIYLPR